MERINFLAVIRSRIRIPDHFLSRSAKLQRDLSIGGAVCLSVCLSQARTM